MGQPDRLGDVAADNRTPNETDGLRDSTSDCCEIPCRPWLGQGEEPMAPEKAPPPRGIVREPFSEGGVDGPKIGSVPGEGDHWHAELRVHLVQVEDVEAAHDHAVHEHGVQAFQTSRRPDEPQKHLRAILAVDMDPSGADRLDAIRRGDRDRGHRCPAFVPPKCAVVDAHDADVHLFELRP
jgi:hypothetical protein